MQNLALIAYLTMGVAVGVPATVAQTRSNAWQGYYVGKADSTAAANAAIEVDIFPAYEGQALYIDFKVTLEVGGEPFGAVAAATDATTHQFGFTYTELSGRRGTGTVSRQDDKLVVQLHRSKHPVTEAMGDWSRTFILRRQSDKARTNRHSWSLGRSRPAAAPKRPPGAY
jgi:hypothetical protein